MQGQELYPMILVHPFKLRTFYEPSGLQAAGWNCKKCQDLGRGTSNQAQRKEVKVCFFENERGNN